MTAPITAAEAPVDGRRFHLTRPRRKIPVSKQLNLNRRRSGSRIRIRPNLGGRAVSERAMSEQTKSEQTDPSLKKATGLQRENARAHNLLGGQAVS